MAVAGMVWKQKGSSRKAESEWVERYIELDDEGVHLATYARPPPDKGVLRNAVSCASIEACDVEGFTGFWSVTVRGVKYHFESRDDYSPSAKEWVDALNAAAARAKLPPADGAPLLTLVGRSTAADNAVPTGGQVGARLPSHVLSHLP